MMQILSKLIVIVGKLQINLPYMAKNIFPEVSLQSFPPGIYNFVYKNLCCAPAVPRVGVAH